MRSSLDLLAPFGRAVVYGAASGESDQIPVGAIFALRSVTGFNLTAWRRADPDRARHEMDEIANLFAARKLRTTVHRSLPLSQAAIAHEIIESRSHTGRILLLPAVPTPGNAPS
ncbi:zinc-binding dehydrogenase [Nonomuraea wenchangensis]